MSRNRRNRRVNPTRPQTVVPQVLQLEDRSVPAGFNAGTIQAQDGWSGGAGAVSALVDQGVNQTGNLSLSGTGALRVSNSTVNGNHNGAFVGWPYSPALSVNAGQPSSGAAADRFTASLWFRSVSNVADGSNIEIDLGNAAGNSRNSFLGIANSADGDGGLQIYLAEPDGTSGNFFQAITEVSGITRGAWHFLEIEANFVNGSANDFYRVFLDGEPVLNSATNTDTFATFEGFYEGTGQAYQPTNRLVFRSDLRPSDLGAFPDNAAQGFAFDEVIYASSLRSSPEDALAYYYANFETQPSVVYVDDYAGNNGDVIADADPNTPGNQPATLGLDAFTSVPAGAAAVAAGGQLFVFTSTSAGNTPLIPNGTTFAPGNAVGGTGVVTTGGVQFEAGALFDVDINGATPGTGYDQLASTGSVNIGSAFLDVTVGTGFVPAAGNVFTIITATNGVVGQFDSLPEGTVIDLNGYAYKIHYTTNSVFLSLDSSDLRVTVTDGATTADFGSTATYTIVVSNAGTTAITGAKVSTIVPAGLTDVLFTSTVTGGATGNTNGVGGPADTLTLPAGASVTYTLRGTRNAAGTLALYAFIDPPARAAFDTNPANNGAGDATFVFPADDIPPTATVFVDGALTAGVSAGAAIIFDEDVNGYSDSGLVVTNANISNFTVVGPRLAVFTITPQAAGTTRITVLPLSAADDAGNGLVQAVGDFDVTPAPTPASPPPPVVPPPPPQPQSRFVASYGNIVEVYIPSDNVQRAFIPYPGFEGTVTAAAADLNGDGIPELITGAGPGGGPNVKVFDGVTNAEIRSFFAFDAGFTGGVNVAAGNGRIVVGQASGGGEVRVFNFTTLATTNTIATGFANGVRVATADLNNDGTWDVVTGNAVGAPTIRTFNGTNGAGLATFAAFDNSSNGVYVAATRGTIVAGVGSGASGAIRSFDANGGLRAANTVAQAAPNGVRVGIADVNSDGNADVITGPGPGGDTRVKGFNLFGLNEIFSIGISFPGRASNGVFVG